MIIAFGVLLRHFGVIVVAKEYSILLPSVCICYICCIFVVCVAAIMAIIDCVAFMIFDIIMSFSCRHDVSMVSMW